MTMIQHGKTVIAICGLLGCLVSQTQAAITLDLEDATTFAKTGVSATLNGNAFIANNELIGVYGFAHSGTPTLPNNGPGTYFYSICLDPLGTVDWSSHTYQRLSFAEANPGVNPAGWSSSGSDYWGIQNANYIWRNNYSTILGSSASAAEKQTMGMALALAMYEALYDSTGYGNNIAGNQFSVATGLSGSAMTYYNGYLASLSGFNTASDIYSGYVLRGAPLIDGQNGQEFLLIGTPVPEVTTLLAGAFLLLPFAASTLRFVRQARAA